MNPVVIIPTYWGNDTDGQLGQLVAYDHATPIDKPLPELENCLSSLDPVRGVMRTVVLVVADPSVQQAARARVDGICRAHPLLNPLVIGEPEAKLMCDVVAKISPDLWGETISLRGYGAIRNMGLAIAAIFGHDVVVFLDDDELVLSENFLIDACYGLGARSHLNTPIVAKTGYFINRHGSAYATPQVPLYDSAWSKHKGFNSWMRHALSDSTPRIVRSNVACGGCLALHAEAFTCAPFDPWITRGEDLDYLLNLRLCGMDLWFDSEWCVRHLPPVSPTNPSRFLQDIYRWSYEVAKLDAAAERIDLHHIAPDSLDPYPGPWLQKEARKKFYLTAFARALACPEHTQYWNILTRGISGAQSYAISNRSAYLAFLGYWQEIISTIWKDTQLSQLLETMGSPEPLPAEKNQSWQEFSGSVGGNL